MRHFGQVELGKSQAWSLFLFFFGLGHYFSTVHCEELHNSFFSSYLSLSLFLMLLFLWMRLCEYMRYAVCVHTHTHTHTHTVQSTTNKCTSCVLQLFSMCVCAAVHIHIKRFTKSDSKRSFFGIFGLSCGLSHDETSLI